MANITNTNQIFVSVNQISNNVIDGDVAGLMGLAFQNLATTGAVPYWLAIVNQLTEQVMAFWLARHVNDNVSNTDLSSGGVFTLGGTNETLFSGTLEFYDVQVKGSAPLAFWLLALASLTVNGVPVTLSINNATCAIDTGTTLIGGPKTDVDALFKNIPQSRLSREAQGFYEIPCNSKTTVGMNFGGTTWPISSQDFILSQNSTSGFCLAAVFILTEGTSSGDADVDNLNPDWVVGDTFLKNVYSVFRNTPPSVGFAELSTAAGGSGTTSGTSPSSSATSAAMSTTIPAFLMFSTAFIATITLCL